MIEPMKQWDYIGWITVDPHDCTEAPGPVMGVVWASDHHSASMRAEEEIWAYIEPKKGPAAGATLLNWYVKPRFKGVE